MALRGRINARYSELAPHFRLGENHPTQIFHHGGARQGAAAFFMLLPEYRISVAAMSNSGASTARLEVQVAAYALARKVVELKKAQLASSIKRE